MYNYNNNNIMLLVMSIILMAAVLGTTTSTGVSAQQLTTITFNTMIDCSDLENPCDFMNKTNYLEGIAPSATTNVIINYKSAGLTQYITLKTGVSATVGALNVGGIGNVEFTVNADLTVLNLAMFSNVSANVQMSSMTVWDTFLLLKGTLFTVYNGSLLTNSTVIVSDGVILTAHDSPITFDCAVADASNTQYLQFNSTPVLVGNSPFTVSGPASTFLVGIRAIESTGMVFLNNTDLYGISGMQQLRVLNDLDLRNGATLMVKDFLSGIEYSRINVNSGTLYVNNNNAGAEGSKVKIYSISSDPMGLITFMNVERVDVMQITAEGNFTIDTVTIFNIGSEDAGLVSNFSRLMIAGHSYLNVDNSNIFRLAVIESKLVNSQPGIFFNLTSWNSIYEFESSLNNTIFWVLERSTLEFFDDASFVGVSGIYLYGEITLDQDLFLDEYPALNIVGGVASMVTNSSTITGDVTISNGVLWPLDTTIYGNLYHNGGTIHFVNTYGRNLMILGNYTSEEGAILGFSDSLEMAGFATIYVAGTTDLEATLMIQFIDDIAIAGADYNILSSATNIVGEFESPEVHWATDEEVDTFKINMYKQRDVILTFIGEKEHHGVPGWGIFLIILAIFVVLGAGVVVYIKYFKKPSGYVPL
ncbi:hypothetical protein SAMD00019534_064660 [Acytostelium subglobosum LB1]|uniref:hypothetical protein n=1 Tax=Acytostelium subglobosum LB1 TaxID=1410327 RepID=UPI000644F875|nr:hypothetical protein SAMD00019534_064660 [Acytostelium subglobosum LB1]GAM23291.1 hypothetical protein SAMD00019534_064660 [Acytostelium subglobosum LB1]|eukprot:XP_012753740.1 hypothetical protein SAMD00019534_064660 [Acytostelium subglobosum LB1]